MFAVLKTGGKQYKVAKDDTLRVERLAAETGETIQFNDILMVGGTVGAPFVEGAAVQAEVVDQVRGDKVIHFVKRRRKHSSKRTKGHRQYLTVIKVTDILEKGGDKTGVKAAIGAGGVAMAALTGAAAAPKKAAKPKAEKPKAEAKPKPKAAPKPKAEAKPKAEKPKAEPKPKAKAKEEAAPAAAGDQPANLLTKPKGGKADDLKKISGVGPKLEGTLHEIGVFHFWQIAEWTKKDIAYMDDRLSFKGRIERDNWIAQAKDFAKDA